MQRKSIKAILVLSIFSLFISSPVMSKDLSKLSKETLISFDIDRDGSYSLEEYRSLIKGTKTKKTRPSDSISIRNKSSKSIDISHTRYANYKSKAIFRRLDMDNNSEVSFNEFIKYRLPMFNDKNSSKMLYLKKQIFLAMDTDRSKTLSSDEVLNFDIIAFVFKKLDQNNNSKLTFAEMTPNID